MAHWTLLSCVVSIAMVLLVVCLCFIVMFRKGEDTCLCEVNFVTSLCEVCLLPLWTTVYKLVSVVDSPHVTCVLNSGMSAVDRVHLHLTIVTVCLCIWLQNRDSGIFNKKSSTVLKVIQRKKQARSLKKCEGRVKHTGQMLTYTVNC